MLEISRLVEQLVLLNREVKDLKQFKGLVANFKTANTSTSSLAESIDRASNLWRVMDKNTAKYTNEQRRVVTGILNILDNIKGMSGGKGGSITGYLKRTAPKAMKQKGEMEEELGPLSRALTIIANIVKRGEGSPSRTGVSMSMAGGGALVPWNLFSGGGDGGQEDGDSLPGQITLLGIWDILSAVFKGVKSKEFKMMFAGISIITGTIKGIWKTLVKSSPVLGGVMDILNEIFSLILMPIGNAIGEGMLIFLPDIIDTMIEWLQFFENDTYGIKTFFTAMGAILGLLLLAGLKIFTFILKFWPVFLLLGVLLTAIGVTLGIMLVAFLAHFIYSKIKDMMLFGVTVANMVANVMQLIPLLLIVAAILIIIGLIYMFWDPIKEFLQGVWEKIKLIWDVMSALRTIFWEVVERGFRWLINDLPGIIMNAIRGIGGGIVDAGKNVVNTLFGWTGLKLATGGYVPSVSGGHLAILGEGGEGEWVIPESKMGQFVNEATGAGGGLQVNVYGNVYADDLIQRIERVVDKKNQQSRYR